jgi:ABC-type microcin C transport system permease subunit YejE
VFFGLKFAWQPAAIGLAVGSVMGYISEQLLILQGKLMVSSAKKVDA